MLLVLDNYDSFTFNLVQYFGQLGAQPEVARNDALTVAQAIALKPQAIVISPGPRTPADAGISIELIQAAANTDIPLLGVCLGHQAIGEAFGGKVIRATRQLHGKTSPIEHNGDALFEGIPSGSAVMRYHSLVVDPTAVPAELEVIAWAADRPRGEEIMAVKHRSRRIWGVQFHPESIGTPVGLPLLGNFLRHAGIHT